MVMTDKFDVYCMTRFSFAEPRFARVCKVDPVIKLIAVSSIINEDSYLDISVSQAEAFWFAKVLKRLGVDVYPIAERYKASSISGAMARRTAQNFVSMRRIQSPNYDFADVIETEGPWWLSKIAYVYFAKSEKMADEEISPPGISVKIDRVTGLILDARELLNFELPVMLTE
jgi:hypothetical protein